MQPLKFGLVGAGGNNVGDRRGLSHARHLAALEAGQIVAVCDIAADAAESAAAQLGATAYTDYEKFLRHGLDVIILATPDPLHAQQAALALEAGVGVISEVPAATTVEDGRRLAQAARKSGGFYMLLENYGYRDEIELRSPVRGRVLRVLQASGGVVAAGTPLLEVGDTTALEIVVDLLTADAAQVPAGATVHLENWGGADALTGHVRLVEPSAFTRVSALGVEEQRVNALVDIHEPHAQWQTLGDGWRVEARIVVWEGARVLTAPLGAVFRRAGAWSVFVVEAGKARRRNVTLGHRGGDRVEVTAGLREGDRVIVHPPDRLNEGDAVVAE